MHQRTGNNSGRPRWVLGRLTVIVLRDESIHWEWARHAKPHRPAGLRSLSARQKAAHARCGNISSEIRRAFGWSEGRTCICSRPPTFAASVISIPSKARRDACLARAVPRWRLKMNKLFGCPYVFRKRELRSYMDAS